VAEQLNLYIAGEWRPSLDGARREIRCPADSQLVATAAEASSEDTLAAIAAAREAFDAGPWPHTPERERADVLRRTADLIDRDRKDFVRAEALDTGKRLVEAEYDMDDVVACLRYYAGVGGTEAGRVVDTGRPDAISRLVYEPIGVCGLITPWNYPCCKRVGKWHLPLVGGVPSC
jgi:betaine-aldehyde dehydrogenase